MAGELFLVTKLNGRDRWAFTVEADILSSLQISYSATQHTIERLDRDTYAVKVEKADVIVADVFTVQRVPLLEAPAHL
jgi:hypothetical protein